MGKKEVVFKSPDPIYKPKPSDYIQPNPVLYYDVLLGLSRIPKRKDKAAEQDTIIAERFSFNASCPTNDDQIVYTCPKGYRAYLNVLVCNVYHSGVAGTDTVEIEVGDDPYAHIMTYAQNQIENIIITPAQGTVLNEGETIHVYTDGKAVAYLNGQGYLYPIS